MVRTHPSTPEQRAQWTAFMLAHRGEYGVVARLSRQTGVSRPTLYAWRAQAQQALVQTFAPAAPAAALTPSLERQVLTVLVQAHASARGIQTCVRTLTQRGLSLATVTAILHTAQQRAMRWMQTYRPTAPRALALDEIYANARCGAYLHVVDVHSGAVWASEGPLPVDSESWTLVLWSLQDRGLVWDRLVGDDGAALQAAARTVTPDCTFQRDQWHVLRSCAQIQARLDRWRATLEAQTVVVARQAARIAAGQRPQGRRPKTDVAAHAADVAGARQLTADVRFLMQEVHRLLDVVVLDQRGLLHPDQRQTEMDTALELLAEVAAAAPAAQHSAIQQLLARLQHALPQLLTFVDRVAQVQDDLVALLPRERQALVAWAWLRRRQLGWRSPDILAALPTDWRAAARVLLASWDNAVRVSSAVERWHSILRPHLAVHRTLTSGMLALLAVWHNHRVFTRGIHKGKSPLQLSGILDAPSDWLVALGYPPEAEGTPSVTPTQAMAA